VRGSAARVELDCALHRPAPAGSPPGAPASCAGSVGGGRVLLTDGSELAYDWLVLALGADARAADVPGAAAHAIPFVSLQDVERCEGALRDAAAARRGAAVRVAVVGAGVSGVELAATLGARLGAGGDVALLTGGPDILPGGTEGQRGAAREALARAAVRVLPRSRVTSLGPPPPQQQQGGAGAGDAGAGAGADAPPLLLQLARGGDDDEAAPACVLAADVVLWAAGCAPAAGGALGASLGADARGALPTDDTLRVRGHERVFALGDAAAVCGAALAPTAQVAFQAADYAAWNVWAAHAGRPLLPFKYQHLGDMMALGPHAAAVALPLGGAVLDGALAALLRRAAYVYRMPTQQQRARVGAAWLERGARAAWEGWLKAGAPPAA
jgi:NADH:ubiquinone reductase (non-electrogenic)